MSQSSNTSPQQRGVELPLSVMTELKQVGMVTGDLGKAIDAMLKTGIGPWTTFTFDSNTTDQKTYYGRPVEHTFRIALAQMPGLMWEIIQPIKGENIYSDFLEAHGEGYHHLLYDCPGMSYPDKVLKLEAAGFRCIQSGRWMKGVVYAYFERTPDHGMIIEIVDRQAGWERPIPDETFA